MSDRVAIENAGAATHARLREANGLRAGLRDAGASDGTAYCGRDFRVYRFMRVGEAMRFYSALHARWNAARLDGDLDLLELREDAEVKRLKRSYQRALVLALALAPEPRTLVVEDADDFDDERTASLLGRAIAACERATVTYGGAVPAAQRGWYDRVSDGDAISPEALAR